MIKGIYIYSIKIVSSTDNQFISKNHKKQIIIIINCFIIIIIIVTIVSLLYRATIYNIKLQ